MLNKISVRIMVRNNILYLQIKGKYLWMLCVLLLLIAVLFINLSNQEKTRKVMTKKFCLSIAHTLRGRHKACFLRPDTGPCRADIVQWYFDVKKSKCYRFFWGGCQGNGNRFETRQECREYCYLNDTYVPKKIPNFCSLPFDYGTCFGHYYRWGFDTLLKSCRRRLYSGCGGNQNNFHTREECATNCITPPNNTMQHSMKLTTCIPLDGEGFN